MIDTSFYWSSKKKCISSITIKKAYKYANHQPNKHIVELIGIEAITASIPRNFNYCRGLSVVQRYTDKRPCCNLSQKVLKPENVYKLHKQEC